MRVKNLSFIQILAHLGALIPLALLVFQYFTGRISVDPIQELTRRSGHAALILLLASLACTPASSLFGFRQAIKIRRPLGLYAFAYALSHFLIFIWADYRFDLELVWLDSKDKPYIFAGFGAFLILSALAFTSFDVWKIRLKKGWKRLHRLVYLAGILVALHFAWVKKADLLRLTGEVTWPLVATGVLALLFLVRLPKVRAWLVKRFR